jgi:hypothetical protein
VPFEGDTSYPNHNWFSLFIEIENFCGVWWLMPVILATQKFLPEQKLHTYPAPPIKAKYGSACLLPQLCWEAQIKGSQFRPAQA